MLELDMVKLEVAHVEPCTLCTCENFLSLEILVLYWQPVLQKKNQIRESSVTCDYYEIEDSTFLSVYLKSTIVISNNKIEDYELTK